MPDDNRTTCTELLQGKKPHQTPDLHELSESSRCPATRSRHACRHCHRDMETPGVSSHRDTHCRSQHLGDLGSSQPRLARPDPASWTNWCVERYLDRRTSCYTLSTDSTPGTVLRALCTLSHLTATSTREHSPSFLSSL